MKVACIQLSTGENYDKNCDDIIKYIHQAIKNKADFIVTPETSSLMSSDRKNYFKYAFEMSNDPIIRKVKNISRIYKKWILLGSICVKERKKLRNRSILINPKGKIIKYYDKINMLM